jgi:hypothetical protein
MLDGTAEVTIESFGRSKIIRSCAPDGSPNDATLYMNTWSAAHYANGNRAKAPSMRR